MNVSNEQLKKIKNDFERLVEETDGKSVFYGTRKYGY